MPDKETEMMKDEHFLRIGNNIFQLRYGRDECKRFDNPNARGARTFLFSSHQTNESDSNLLPYRPLEEVVE